MKRFISITVAVSAMGVLSATTAGAASTTAQETLSGNETGVPQPNAALCGTTGTPQNPVVASPFAGSASGTISGTWSAQACHGNIPTNVGGSTPLLPGGAFTLTGTRITLTGAFGAGGTITLTSFSGNPNWFNTQTYTITGETPCPGAAGTGAPLVAGTSGNIVGGCMNVTLTHYLFGSYVYSASVKGTASITH